MKIEGPTKPLFERLSQVRMLEWETSQRKRVIFGQCLRFQILCQTFLVERGST
jgi:hypothetical protein